MIFQLAIAKETQQRPNHSPTARWVSAGMECSITVFGLAMAGLRIVTGTFPNMRHIITSDIRMI
jgi:hypothetical protein